MLPLPRRDRLGRPQKDFKMLGHETTLTALCAQTGMGITVVPPAYWALDEGGDEPTATVACPCGEDIIPPLLEGPRMHESCERGYFFDGRQVWALHSPKPQADAAPAQPGVDVPEEPSVD